MSDKDDGRVSKNNEVDVVTCTKEDVNCDKVYAIMYNANLMSSSDSSFIISPESVEYKARKINDVLTGYRDKPDLNVSAPEFYCEDYRETTNTPYKDLKLAIQQLMGWVKKPQHKVMFVIEAIIKKVRDF